MSAGAFSDATVLQAAERITCIFVECDWGKKNKDVSDKYKVSGYPTVLFCDPDGKLLGSLNSDEPAGVARQMLELADKYKSKADSRIPVPQLTGMTFQEARPIAKKSLKPVLFYFSDDSPGSIAVNQALVDDSLRDILGRFVLAKADYVKGSPECVKFDVTRAPTILVLDCSLEKPEEKPLARIAGSRNVRELRRDLESALPARSPEPGATSKPSGPAPKQPEEKYSDDEIERRFIQARVSVAQDMIKRGKKDQAIEVYEDIIKSYPKHVDTQTVKKLLEEARK